MLFLQPCRDQLSDIEHLHGAFRLFFGGFFSDHAHTERTTCGDGLGPCLLQLTVTVGAHSLSSFFFFLPKLAPRRRRSKSYWRGFDPARSGGHPSIGSAREADRRCRYAARDSTDR